MTLGPHPQVSLTLLRSSQVRQALGDVSAEDVNVPVYDSSGAVTGWVDMTLDTFTSSTITGSFKEQGESVALTSKEVTCSTCTRSPCSAR